MNAVTPVTMVCEGVSGRDGLYNHLHRYRLERHFRIQDCP